ncbi:MAG: ACP S-malonyltransferase [Phycisphaerales bacterium]
MSSPIVMLCPGQGAQAVGMGKAWHDASDAARAVLDEADEIVAAELGAPLSKLCFEGPSDRLNQTDVSQPAIYAVSVACFRALEASEGSIELEATAGLSLGEYTALHLAGVFSFADGLRLVTKRGRYMQDAAEASEGSMVALIGADEEQAHTVCEKAAQGETLVGANFNAPGQIVLSGTKAACDRAVEVAGASGLRATPLTVAGAFHSDLMAPASDKMRRALDEVDFAPPLCPVVSNVTARPHETDPTTLIKERLVEQITSPVRWSQSCEWLVGKMNGEFHELAPGKVLSGLMRRIHRPTKVVNHDTPGE